jgi:DNA mismatch repair protein MutL
MSGIIKLLPDHIANQIAAGEVIQRPASVVKEMMENAIDAGATKIQVIIKDAGRTQIRIIDNGLGMTEEDAIMCFERHATSKVSTAEDLFALRTKGFRGEALASIAAIAHVTLKTKKEHQETGTLIEMEGSRISTQEATTCPAGTSFEVKNLFFNVPARRNFLKSDTVEFGHIRDEFERIVLAHPELSFTLTHNDSEIYNLPSAVLRKRIVDVLGKSSNDKLVPIEEDTDIVSIRGYVGKPEFSKRSRGEQFLFVNNRFFKDTYFNHAITKAYEGLIAPKHFPSYFLYLTVDPSKIDVNVHPTKTEIKFEEDRHIYSILLSSIRQALGKYNIAPTLDFERETSFDLPLSMKDQPVTEPVIRVNPDFNPFRSTSSNGGSTSKGNHFTNAIRAEGFGNTSVSQDDWADFYKIEEIEGTEKEDELQNLSKDDSWSNHNFLFQGKYMFTTSENGLFVIHWKRAYERVVYDELMNNFITNPIASQKLLFPMEKELSKADKEALESNRSLLQRFGFEWTINSNTLEIQAVPALLQEDSIISCIEEVLEKIAYQTIDKGEIAHAVVLSIASTSSSKKKLSDNESARILMDQFSACNEHLSPEGKKVIEHISHEEINKRF